jgi:deoxyribodipyrimidine photo-lyase
MKICIYWFRRDLRLEDNAALYFALKENRNIQPIFIFDKNILSKLEVKSDARVSFIYNEILKLKKELNENGSDLWIYYDEPINVFSKLIKAHDITHVYTNRDYEPYAKNRDSKVSDLLQENGVGMKLYKDQVIFEMDEVVKDNGDPYTVFTPYSKKWKAKYNSYYSKSYPSLSYLNHLNLGDRSPVISLKEMGFEKSAIKAPSRTVSRGIIKDYDKTRDIPGIKGTSKLGVHFRFGTISIREKARRAMGLNQSYLNELIWRDFYMMILHHFPHVVNGAFRAKYNNIKWRNDEEDFEKWCRGKTGYPIVDAGMRELNETGYMHNRVRMIVASFLCKHLLINWQWGEAYFAKKLLDFDLSANNGGWQWAAGSGCDAAPYFRVFNPYLQTDKFDKDRKYIQKWVPEYESDEYPEPIVDHKFARERALETYKAELKKD